MDWKLSVKIHNNPWQMLLHIFEFYCGSTVLGSSVQAAGNSINSRKVYFSEWIGNYPSKYITTLGKCFFTFLSFIAARPCLGHRPRQLEILSIPARSIFPNGLEIIRQNT